MLDSHVSFVREYVCVLAGPGSRPVWLDRVSGSRTVLVSGRTENYFARSFKPGTVLRLETHETVLTSRSFGDDT